MEGAAVRHFVELLQTYPEVFCGSEVIPVAVETQGTVHTLNDGDPAVGTEDVGRSGN